MQLAQIGVTPQKEKQFASKGIFTVENLVWFFPRAYIDCSKITPLSDGNFCVVKLIPQKISCLPSDPLSFRVSCKCVSSSGIATAFFFKQSRMYNQFVSYINKEVVCAGEASYNSTYNNWTFSNPFLFTDNDQLMKIYPVYSKIKGMSEEYIRNKIERAFEVLNLPEQILPPKYATQLGIPLLSSSLKSIHSPVSTDEIKRASFRFNFESLQYFATKMQINNANNKTTSPYALHETPKALQIAKELPFELTKDQKETIRTLFNTATNGERINALVQGDVGCGKSIVAYLTMIGLAENGHQVALMAPTQILAEQHLREFSVLAAKAGLTVDFIGGATTAKEKRETLYRIKTGETKVVIGTHALVSDSVSFKNLGLVIVDEEHKFGVEQRDKLKCKALEYVHFISMSATPIPRSLATVMYGDAVQLYSIKSMPKGRKPIITKQVSNQNSIFEFLSKEIQNGRQAYVVCPMIDENEDMTNVASVEEVTKMYSDALNPKGIKIGVLTGRTAKADFDNTIQDFTSGHTHVLIATTVVEVGVNVPNASVIVIHSAERFGLSGLHQLRGRVGRGGYQSYCLLVSESQNNVRLNAMCKTNDGFEIAEADLQNRGTGELIGVKQSGEDKYLTLMLANPKVYKKCVGIANDMISENIAEVELANYCETVLQHTPKKDRKKAISEQNK